MSKLDKDMLNTNDGVEEACANRFNTSNRVKPRKSKESILSKIKTKVQASKKIIADIANHQYKVLSDTIFNDVTKLEELRPFSFNTKAFLEKERVFFLQNSTPLGVLQTLDHYVKEEKQHPWELFPMVHFSVEQIKGNCFESKLLY